MSAFGVVAGVLPSLFSPSTSLLIFAVVVIPADGPGGKLSPDLVGDP
jgi:hypothetical protein